MPSFDATPGSLNFSFEGGDDFSALIDFSVSLVGRSVSAEITSIASGETVVPFSVSVSSAAEGKVNLALSDSQTASLQKGTYGWNLRWVEGNATQTALTGFVEVL